ncbi:hypothetical protein SAMN04488057_1035 [Cyclobacterium lianum]|uniref:Uncharacterized protein n=1 Tax=Cyclobacterium lianum TaxID=388280 RepID=A0A1M7KWJ9_9BACT|nr:hypothetical protein SAMN04488057_1035 [Cyclobacterium lianum]
MVFYLLILYLSPRYCLPAATYQYPQSLKKTIVKPEFQGKCLKNYVHTLSLW